MKLQSCKGITEIQSCSFLQCLDVRLLKIENFLLKEAPYAPEVSQAL